MQELTYMKKLLLLTVFSAVLLNVSGQGLSFDDLVGYLSAEPVKFDKQLAKNRFFYSGINNAGDTVVKVFEYRPARRLSDTIIDSTQRFLMRNQFSRTEFSITYITSSKEEFDGTLRDIKRKGFYCHFSDSNIHSMPLLYQHRDMTSTLSLQKPDSIDLYSVEVFRKSLPKLADIYFGDDLLSFTSHEYLTYFFGEKNVAKDIYYFSGNRIANCSVLFPNTKRQAVFLWQDEGNKCKIKSILFGGHQPLESIRETDRVIAENSWMMKSGLHAGMQLAQLLLMNKYDFIFNGGNSANEGVVTPEKTGEIDFKKEEVLLGCINCNDDSYQSARLLSAHDAVKDGRIMFVLSVTLNPNTQ